jgi:hypothetical protein
MRFGRSGGHRGTRIARRLTALAVGYLFLVQTLLVGVAGARVAADAIGQGVPAFELCQHGADQNAPAAPDHHHDGSCVCCLAGAHAQPPLPGHAALRYAPRAHALAWAAAVDRHAPSIVAYSIAHPRGPPPSA